MHGSLLRINMQKEISAKEKTQLYLLLIILIIIGGFVLYRKPNNTNTKPSISTAPKVKGPTTPPPSNNEIKR